MTTKITTKYQGPTDFKGSRIVAKHSGRRLSMPYQHELSSTQNHARAAAMLASKLKLSGHYVIAKSLEHGYVFEVSPDADPITDRRQDAFRVGAASSAIPFSYTLLK